MKHMKQITVVKAQVDEETASLLEMIFDFVLEVIEATDKQKDTADL